MLDNQLALNDPARKAGRTARLIGIILTFFGVLVVAVSASIFFQPGPMLVKAVTLFACAIYLAPGIALIWLAGHVSRAGRGATLATMVIAILLALLMSLVFAGQAMILATSTRAGTPSGSHIGSLLLGGILCLATTGLAVYCGQSLRFPDRAPLTRGFEPLMTATPLETIEPTDSDDVAR